MQLGASAPRQRPQLVNLNVIPAEYRRRPFPVLTTGLALLLVGSVLLLYGIFYMKTFTDMEVRDWAARVAQAQDVVRAATAGETEANQDRQQLLAMREDYRALAERQVRWSEVFGALSATPPGVVLSTIEQAGYTITVRGAAPSYAAATQYLEKLRAGDLFMNLSIEVSAEPGAAVATATPRAPTPPTPPAARTALPPGAQPVPAGATPTRAAQPPPTATPALSPSPTATPTPAPTRTPVPTPAFDWAVESRTQKPHTQGPPGVRYVRGRVLDVGGNPVAGVQLRISSEGGGWSADGPQPPRSDGTFEFVVTNGRFSLQVLDGRSEVAGGLYTGADGSSEAFDWEVVYRKVPPVPTPAPELANGSPAPTPTITSTPTPSPTPISPGPNIAPDASLSVSNNGNDARAAVDGNVDTIWNAQTYPVASIQLDFGRLRQVEGVELVISQDPAGSTTHELWVLDETGNWTLQTTFQGTTKDRDTLAYRFSPARSISRIYVRTIRGPSFVAWREIRVYEPLPSPSGFPTATPTPLGPTATPTRTPTATPTSTAFPMPTPVTTPGLLGDDITYLATPVASARQSDADRALDGDTNTYWSAGAPPVKTLRLDFADFHQIASVELLVGYVDPSTGAHRDGTAPQVVEIGLWDGIQWVPQPAFQFSGSYADGQLLAYLVSPPQTASSIYIQTISGPDPVAWREIRVHEARGAPAPPTTPTPTVTSQPATPSPTPTPTATTTPGAGAAAGASLAAARPAAGFGLGPGPAAPLAPTPPPPGLQPPGSGPVAFVIVLEARSGGGYR